MTAKRQFSHIDMNGLRVFNLPTPTVDADAATKVYVDSKSVTGGTPDTWQVSATGTTVTSTTATAIAGLSQTVTSNGVTDVFLIDMSLDVTVTTNGSFVAELFVDGVAQGSQGVMSLAANSRLPVDKEFRVTGLATGNHTFDIRCRVVGTASYTVNATHSIMRVARVGQQFGDGPQVICHRFLTTTAGGFTNGTDFKVPFDTQVENVGGIVYTDNGAGDRYFTIPTAGTYLITASVRWAAQPGVAVTSITVNNAAGSRQANVTSSSTMGNVTHVTALKAGDVVRVLAQQQTGSTQSVNGDSGRDTAVKIVRVAGSVQSTDVPYTVPTLSNSWTSYDGGATYDNPAYTRLDRVVYLKGIVKHATTTTTGLVFTLPAGLRPFKKRQFITNAGAGLARIEIAADGSVTVNAYVSSGSASALVLDGILFPAEQ